MIAKLNTMQEYSCFYKSEAAHITANIQSPAVISPRNVLSGGVRLAAEL